MRIAVSGYYGCGNTGDEAVLAGIAASFKKRAGSSAAKITVLSQRPEETERLHGLRAVDRMNMTVVRQLLRQSDLLLSGGGSLLQDTTSLRSVGYYLLVVRLALAARRPAMFYAQGVGPLRRRSARVMTRMVANRVQQITVRDAGSRDLLAAIGVRRPPIEVTADPAFALEPAPRLRAREILADAGVPADRPLIGIAIRPWEVAAPAPETYATMADTLAKETGARPVFLPMQPPGDVEIAERVGAAMRQPHTLVRTPLTPSEAVAVVGEMAGLVAMRLHALIFGAMGAVPMVALCYDPKVPALMERLGQKERALPLSDMEPAHAAGSLVGAIAEGDRLRQALGERARELTEMALANVDRALALRRP